jgi:maltose O-acetyltransferase
METTPHAAGRTMRERMLAGDLYLADDPELDEASAVALELMTAYNATGAGEGPRRRELLERLLGAIGEDTVLRPPVYVDYADHRR